MSLLDEIDGAEVVVVEPDFRLVCVWFGGHGVRILREDGVDVDYFTIDGAKMPTRQKVIKQIREYLNENLNGDES